MSIKSNGRAYGKVIRKVTGLKLPIAMKIGKLLAQDAPESVILKKFPEFITRADGNTNSCCGRYSYYTLQGPKGKIITKHSFYVHNVLSPDNHFRERTA